MPSPLVPDRAPAELRPDCEKPSSSEQPGTITHLSTHVAPPEIPDRAPFCCAGVDLPGVGHVHSDDCPYHGGPAGMLGGPIAHGRPYVAGEVPEPLRSLVEGADLSARDFERIRQMELKESKRERLLCQLMFAAKDLGEAQIEPLDGDEPAFCTECVAEARMGDAIAHEDHCRTGRVLGILRDLAATLPEFNPSRKEAAPDGETGRAGDGIRPRGIPLTDAARSLRQAALEEMVSLPGRLTWQCNVCGSSVTGLDKTERDIVHGCDCWVGNALVVLSSDDLEGGAQ